MNNFNGPHYNDDERSIQDLPQEEIDELEENRLAKLEEWGINESDVISEIHRNLGSWQTYFEENNTKAKEDLEFLCKDQWTSIERSEFDRVFKPALVINKLYDPYRKVVGEQRNNTPNFKVRSLTGKSSQESINLHSDLIRQISYAEDTKTVYQQCFQSALAFSYGAYLIGHDYESSDSFFQKITYTYQNEPEKCFWDPRAIKANKEDGQFCGVYHHISMQEFDAKNPNMPHPTSFSDPQTITQFQWYTKDIIVVCEYWVKEYYTKTIYKLGNGETVTPEEYQELKKLHKRAIKHVDSFELDESMIEGLIPPMFEIVDERTTDDYILMHYVCTADKILEFEEWPGRKLPLVFVDGDSYYEQGQQYTRTFINQAKDAQRSLNYIACEIAAQIKNSSRSQWMGTPANVEGQEWMWKNPELQQGIMLANVDPKTNSLPIKLPPSEIPQTLFMHYQRATQDINETLGFYEANKGAPGNEISGTAIANRAMQGVGSASIFFSNLERAIECGLKIVADMMPNIYDTERTLTLTQANGEQYTVTINEDMPTGDSDVRNAIDTSDFDIELDVGASFAIQKQQAMDLLIQLVKISPETFPYVADLLVKNFDVEFSQQLSERFKTLVPPRILALEKGEQPPPEPPNPQLMMAQKQMQLADAKLKEQYEELELKKERLQLEKAEFALKMQELQHKIRQGDLTSRTQTHNAELNFAGDIAKIVADLEKNGVKFSKESLG